MLGPWISWSGCGQPAACSPRTRRPCCSPRPAATGSSRAGSPAGSQASLWSTSSAGRSSPAAGWSSRPGCSCRVAAPSCWPARRSRRRAKGSVPSSSSCAAGSPRSPPSSREEVPDADVYAVDDDPAAVACAEANLGDAGTVLLGDLADAAAARAPGPGDGARRQPAARADRRDRADASRGPRARGPIRARRRTRRHDGAAPRRRGGPRMARPRRGAPARGGSRAGGAAGGARWPRCCPTSPARHTRPTGVRVDDAIGGTVIKAGTNGP